MVRPDWGSKLPPMSYAVPLESEYWDDDASAEFAETWQHIKLEDATLSRGE